MKKGSVVFHARQLSELVALRYGKSLPARARTPGPFPVYGSGGVVGFHEEAMVKGPGIIVGRKGSIGAVHYEQGDFWPIDTVFFVEPVSPAIDLRFLANLLREIGLSQLNSDAAVPGLNRNVALAQKVRVPPFAVQRKIAAILSAYDDLIENSLRRIEILEEMARDLYCEWFRRFRFPGHERARFVDSSLGRVPEGWSVLTLADVCVTMSSGGTPPRADAECWNPAELNWFKTGELRDSLLQESEEKISGDGMSRSSARMFRRGTVLMAIYGASVGRLGVLTRSAACNQAALGMVTDRRLLSQEYLFYCLLELRERFRTIAQGAAQQNLSKDKVASSRCVVPPMVLVENFSEHVSTTWDMVAALLERIAALRQARDLLLPKLISGEIDVSALPVRLVPLAG